MTASSRGRPGGSCVRRLSCALDISRCRSLRSPPIRGSRIAVIAVSRYVREYLISAGVEAERVQTIYDGVPKPDTTGPSSLRAELGLDAEAVIGCMVAIMRDKKGHEDLIEAAEPLLAKRPNLHFVMASNGDTFARVSETVESRGLGRRIHLLGFRSDITNVLRGCDFFVLPTHQEALGQSFIEAMAVGLPVIGTSVDGVPELIENDVNGLLVPPKDPLALRAVLLKLIDDPDLRARLGAKGRNIIERGFSIGDMAGATVELYLRGLHERRHA